MAENDLPPVGDDGLVPEVPVVTIEDATLEMLVLKMFERLGVQAAADQSMLDRAKYMAGVYIERFGSGPEARELVEGALAAWLSTQLTGDKLAAVFKAGASGIVKLVQTGHSYVSHLDADHA